MYCYQVALADRNGTIFGSGALVDGQNVVTLAHTVARWDPFDQLRYFVHDLQKLFPSLRPDEITLILGASDFLRPIDSAADAVWFTSPKQIFIHEEFDPLVQSKSYLVWNDLHSVWYFQSFANNIAVLRIPLAPCGQKNICPVCINDLPVGADSSFDKAESCLITGWGPTNSAGQISLSSK